MTTIAERLAAAGIDVKPDNERQDVIAWLTSAIGWTLHKIDARPKGRSVYIFWEGDTNGWNTVHTFRADQLRWRNMQSIGLECIPELRAKRDAIWAEYLASRPRILAALQVRT